MKRDRRDFIRIMASGAVAASLVPLCASGEEIKPKPETQGEAKKSRSEEALSLMGEYGSCCSGVLAAYAAEVGMEKDLAGAAGRGMAGGIGGLGNVCGAVSGAAIVIGLKTTNEDNIHDREANYKTIETVREFVARFEEQHSSIKCRELTGHDISTREKSAAAMKEKAFANCPKYVASAVTILDEMFSSSP